MKDDTLPFISDGVGLVNEWNKTESSEKIHLG
jgi:hypothetical protein